ncbi:PAS domain S-box protein [Guyparkeria hydrothermalis]|uniref:PAS domain S-box protein n=1 Tax=Guyparkeria hydrothermalis TaxID=923 RepID=UPI00201FD819|nr:PAS domain S-box protein [Guyparkeria hydrothermalis]MCL7743566.1 PAS domain S-box protein [Guyparkeria hydrothermalis]
MDVPNQEQRIRELEAALETEKERADDLYAEMFTRNAAPKLLIAADSGQIVDANPAAISFYGYDRETLLSLNISDINTANPDEIASERQRAAREERRYFRFCHRLASGEVRDVEVYSGPVIIEGTPCLHSIIHDVTETRRYQERLEHYREIFESLPVGVYENAPGDDGHFSAVNPAMVDIFEAEDAEELMATPTARLYPDPADRKAFSDKLLEAGELQGEVLHLQTLKGRPIEVSLSAMVRHTDDGDVVFGGVMSDITEQEQTRQQLIESETRHCSILDAMAEGVILQNREGEVVEANASARRILGVDDSELLGCRSDNPRWQAIYPDGSPFPGDEHPISISLRDGVSVREQEMGLPQPDGRTRWLRINSEPLFLGDDETPSAAVATFIDVTDRFESRQRLAHNESRYRDLVENQPQIVHRYLPDTTITFANGVLARLMGTDAENLVGYRWIGAIEPEARDEILAELNRLTPDNPVNHYENALTIADGSKRWIHWTNRAFFDENGKLVELQAVGVDLTERRELEEKQKQLTEIIDALPDLVAIATPDGEPFYYNRAGLKMLGIDSIEQQRGTNARDRHPPWAVSLIVNTAQPIAREKGWWQGETVFIDWHGNEIPVLQTIIAHYDADGELTRYSTMMRDLSEQKAREYRLRQLTAILEATPDFISLADPDGKVLYINRGGRRLLGLREDSDRPVEDEERLTMLAKTGAWAQPDWAAKLIKQQGIPQAIRDGQWEGETALITASGEELPVSQVILSHRDDDGRLQRLSTIIRDISRHKHLEHALERRQSTLETLQRITASNDDLETRLHKMLELGAETFGLPYGVISHVRGNEYYVRTAISPGDVLKPGMHFDLEKTYCVHTLAANAPTGFHEAGKSSIRNHPCYTEQGLEAYLGAPIHVGNAVFGTLSFSRPEPHEPYSTYDWQLVSLMAQWVSYELTQEADRRALESERNRFIGGPTVVVGWRWETGSPITYVSPNVEAVFGLKQTDLIGQHYLDRIHPSDRAECRRQLKKIESGDFDQVEREYRMQNGHGDYRWVHDFVVADRDSHGAVESLNGYLLDATQRRALEADQRLLAVAFQTGQALMLLSPDWCIERVNDAFTRLTGYAADEVVGRDPLFLDSTRNSDDFRSAFSQALSQQGCWEGEVHRCHKDGHDVPLWESICSVTDGAGQIEHYVSVFHDISEQKRVERELEHLASHDRLTGAFNRGQIYELLDAAETARQRYGTPFSVLMFDIDHFKRINDTFGHQAGDQALVELSRRVDSLLRITDQFGRWGGEEFLVIATHTPINGAIKLAERIRETIGDTPFPDIGTVTVSIGVAEMRDGLTIKSLEARADHALYAAKDGGRNQVQIAARSS